MGVTTTSAHAGRGGAPDGIKAIPSESAVRERIRLGASRRAAGLDRARPPLREGLAALGEGLLGEAGMPRDHLGFAMVCVNNEFWRAQFAAVPTDRRLLLLPHCLRDPSACAGTYDAVGLDCVGCAACDLAGLKAEAEALGYRVLIAEGTPAVVEIVLSGRADAILGVACLDSLDEAFDRIAQLGVPNVAVPLLVGGCKDTRADLESIRSWLRLRSAGPAGSTRTYVPLLRAARSLFEPAELGWLLGGALGRAPEACAGAPDSAEALALDWLQAGGKRFRPFITLAAYAALAHGPDALRPGADLAGAFPTPVKLLALAIEVFHKASLVHDDIEDDDPFRYGRPTLHRGCGIPTAVNVGDYLVGLGYRCVASAGELGAVCVGDILGHLSHAHVQLCRGQGAELAATHGAARRLSPKEVQSIYVLKTAPAFETSMFAGLRAAAATGEAVDVPALRAFSRYLGMAYQVANDLKDWDGDAGDKVVTGGDALNSRPTMIRALAAAAGLEGGCGSAAPPVPELRALYELHGVFSKARELVRQCKEAARARAQSAQPPALSELLSFIVETVL